MQLTTPRLLLREYRADDWRTVWAYQSDPRYLRYYDWTVRTESDVQDFVQRLIDWRGADPRIKFQFAVVLQEENRLIGSCGIRKEIEDARQADIGYELDPPYWGRGYATEAARALLAFGFRELRLHRIWARCVAENIASAQVMERLGMRLEGHLRENDWFKDRWWDTLVYGILEHEWNDNKNKEKTNDS